MTSPPDPIQPEKPTLIYDGECSFCRHWVESWQKKIGGAVDAKSSQSAISSFPQLKSINLSEAVALVDQDGTVYQGAEAVFRALAKNPKRGKGLWFYQKFPGGAGISEWFYRRVSRHRGFFSGLLRWFLGREMKPNTYYIPRRLFLILLGLVYLFAFVSLLVQVKGLIGSEGILPAHEYLKQVGLKIGGSAYWEVPTVFWLGQGDLFLIVVCCLGAGLSLLLIAGVAPLPVLFLLWFFYLSLYSVGQTFLGFQWDILLLETGFLAIFFSPLNWKPRRAIETKPPYAVLWLMRWLLFRLMFLSGMVKLLSKDPHWMNMTAMNYHYETQPLPNWISYWFHHLPDWVQRESTWAMFILELVVPFFIFIPGKTRILGAFLLAAFQTLIIITGNYGFFNILTISLCILLIPDRDWPNWIKKRFYPWIGPKVKAGIRNWPKFLIAPLVILILTLSVSRMERRLGDWNFFSSHFAWLLKWTQSLHLANNYGLFSVMTTKRPEITVEGSHDGEDWKPYRFKYKPGELNKRPEFVVPHMPRLDWQMWFAALSRPGRYPMWFHNFLIRLLEGSPDVLKLLRENPFPDQPPKFVRAQVSNYHFTTPEQKKETGNWWVSGPQKAYTPVYENRGGRIIRHTN